MPAGSPHAPRILGPDDLTPYLEHCQRVWAQSGVGTVPIFHTMDLDEFPPNARLAEIHRDQWTRPIGVPGWGRSWGIFADDRIVAGLRLHSSTLRSRLHRVTLGIMIEDEYRFRGWGRVLMTEAISWCRSQPGIAWIDLETYAHHEAALKLYSSLGFVRTGLCEDFARLHGRSIDEVRMSLRL